MPFLSRSSSMGSNCSAIFVTCCIWHSSRDLRASPGRSFSHQVAEALFDPLRQNLPTPTTSAAPSAAAT